MNAFLIENTNKVTSKLILEYAKKLGIKTKKISNSQLEDHHFAEQIEKGMKTDNVSRDDIMSLLD
jgi:hypothetical protein